MMTFSARARLRFWPCSASSPTRSHRYGIVKVGKSDGGSTRWSNGGETDVEKAPPTLHPGRYILKPTDLGILETTHEGLAARSS